MILAILVLYKLRLEQSNSFRSLFGSSPWPEDIQLLVYDNSPTPMHGPEEFADPNGRIRYVSDTSNPGVSKAYNVGATLAKTLGKEFILLLDQDTMFPAGAWSAYVAAITTRKECRLFVPILDCSGRIYSPCWHGFSIYLPLRKVTPGVAQTKNRSVLNSGVCVALDAFEEVGGFDENIPFYFSDHDFMRRYRAQYKTLYVLDVICSHNLSDKGPPDLTTALGGFDSFCRGSRSSIKGVLDVIPILPMSLARLARLSLRFRSTAFFPVFLNRFFRKPQAGTTVLTKRGTKQ
jgi:rhamnosyltransferase